MTSHPSAPRGPSRFGGRRGARRSIVAVAAAVLALAALAGVAVARDSASHASAATPQRGGTLKLLGTSDIFNLDTVSGYYTVSYLIERAFTRQLLSYKSPANYLDSIKLSPDIATSVPTIGHGISADGKTYTLTLRPGVMWNSSPPRQVVADDFVREFKTLCNPSSPVGAPGYFTSTIVGMKAYCAGFAKVKPTVAAIQAYISGHQLAGVSAPNPTTIVFKLVSPAPDFNNILAMPFSSARPVEYDAYVPDSADMRQHTLSDGPYEITSYVPTKSFTFVRNPAWTQSSDPIRHDYIDGMQVTEGLSAQSVQQQLQAGTGDMEWDLPGPPPQDLPALIKKKDPNLIIGPKGPYDVALFYYLTLNTYAGPLKNKLVREAVATAVNKQAVVQITGGPAISSVSNQMVLPGNVGYIKGYNAFPANKGTGNAAAAKALLKKAGFPNGGVKLKLLESTNDPAPRINQAIQSSLNAAGFKVTLVPVTQSDFYGKYLYQPSTAKRDVWDIATPGWIPDWFGNNGRTVLQPLFTSPGVGSSDFGGYTAANALVTKALSAKTPAAAATLWTTVNKKIETDVAAVSLNASKVAIYHSSRVEGCNFWWDDLSCDVTNIWLKQ